MARISSSEAIESLAAEIGETIYLDIAKWHLFLSNAHLHTVLAEQLYPLLAANSIQEEDVLKILRSIPVKIGGGKHELPLLDFLPMHCQANLMELLEEFQRNL